MKWIFGFVIFLIGVAVVLGYSRSPSESFTLQAQEKYMQGLKETDTFLKNRAFNEAIDELLKDPTDSIKKNVLMGAALFNLRQYPLSEYFYLKALKKNPDNQEIRADLGEAIKSAGVKTLIPDPSQFPPSSWRVGAFLLGLFCLLALFVSLKSGFLKKMVLLLSLLAFLIFFYFVIQIFRAPIFAVLIHAQVLFQEPSKEAPAVSAAPIAPGLIVNVLDVAEQGHWIKIRTEEGVMGYVPALAIRLVD